MEEPEENKVETKEEVEEEIKEAPVEVKEEKPVHEHQDHHAGTAPRGHEGAAPIHQHHEQKKHEEHHQKPVEKKPREKFNGSAWYDRNYKKLLILSLVIFAFCIAYLCIFYAQHGDIMKKDVSLTGGTMMTVYQDVNVDELSSFLGTKMGQECTIRKLEDITTRKTIAFVVQTEADAPTIRAALEEFLGYELNEDNSSTEISSASLAKSFYKQLIIAMIIAFVFMAIVIFLLFKTFVPSMAVILSAMMDILGALVMVDMMGVRISSAGIAAFLMLIGYSVDTDIMLTAKTVKRRGEGTLNSRIYSSLKTGLVMTPASLVAVLAAYFIVQSLVLKEMFLILSCGLFMDLIGTWLGNAAIIKWYCEKHKYT